MVTYPGAVGIIQASWNWPYARKDMEIYGQRGSVLVPRPDLVRLRGTTTAEQELKAPALRPPFDDSISYLAAIARGKIPADGLSFLANNLLVTEILDAAAESARTGRRVDLPPESPVR